MKLMFLLSSVEGLLYDEADVFVEFCRVVEAANFVLLCTGVPGKRLARP
jgi:hypothetical protein